MKSLTEFISESLSSFECVDRDMDMLKTYDRDSAKYVHSNNGFKDLERAGKSGYGVWVFTDHNERGRAMLKKDKLFDIINDEVISSFIEVVNKKYKTQYTEADVHVDDKWDTTDGFRLYVLK